MRYLLLLLLLLVWTEAQVGVIDNAISEGPVLECDDGMLSLRVGTKNDFEGRIFVRGASMDTNCVKAYTPKPMSSPNITLPLGLCGMKRMRMPDKSVEYRITVVVSFHPIFITQVDKAYGLRCRFSQLNETLTGSMNVSEMGTTELLGRGGEVECRYEVRSGSAEGPIVEMAAVGDAAFHIWACDTTTMKILVRSCFVEGDEGEEVEVIDEDGCSVDSVVVSDLSYSQPGLNRAVAKSRVFKFADAARLRFRCQIEICLGDEKDCPPIPPQCGARGQIRVRRNSPSRQLVMVESNPYFVQDIEAEEGKRSSSGESPNANVLFSGSCMIGFCHF